MKIISCALLLISLLVPVHTNAEESILQRLWKNTLISCAPQESCENLAEIAEGRYIRNGAPKYFVLVQRAEEKNGIKKMFVRLEFLGNQGDKYLLRATHPIDYQDHVGLAQFVRYHEIDIHRIRRLALPLWQALKDTQVSPFFLTLPFQLLALYNVGENTNIEGDTLLVNSVVSEHARNILPDHVRLLVEEKEGYMAPTYVQFTEYDETLFAYSIQNKFTLGKLRPYRIQVDIPEDDEIIFDTWRIVQDTSYFKRVGFAHDIIPNN
jgi:hypothetical protein